MANQREMFLQAILEVHLLLLEGVSEKSAVTKIGNIFNKCFSQHIQHSHEGKETPKERSSNSWDKKGVTVWFQVPSPGIFNVLCSVFD